MCQTVELLVHHQKQLKLTIMTLHVNCDLVLLVGPSCAPRYKGHIYFLNSFMKFNDILPAL